MLFRSVIEGCRFGYDPSREARSERTQTQAVTVAGDALEVICRDNFVAATAGNAVAYVLTAATGGARQCRLLRNTGIGTATGPWLGDRQPQAVQRIASNGIITTSGLHSVWVTAASPVIDVGVQAGSQNGQTIIVINDGPAASTINFGRGGASNVAEGAQPVAGLSSRILIWNGEHKLWHSFE